MRKEASSFLILATLAMACSRDRGTPESTRLIGATESPTPPAELSLGTFGPEEVLSRISEFPASASLLSANGRYEVKYSQMLLDYTGVKSIESTYDTALDSAWDTILNDAYKLARVPQGNIVTLAGMWQYQGKDAPINPTNLVSIEGKINVIRQYVVTAEEFDEIEKEFLLTNTPYIKNYEIPSMDFTMSILFFNVKGELIIINWSDFREAVNHNNSSYFVIQSGPANAYVAIRESVQAGQNRTFYLLPPDPIYLDLGCNKKNSYCLRGEGDFHVTFK